VQIKWKLAGLSAGLVAAVMYTDSTAQAADEWTTVSSMGHACEANYSGHSRTVNSSVRSGDATATYLICWNDDLTDVRVEATVWDHYIDGYHPEARIRYQVWTGSGWSGYHYRTVVSTYGAGTDNSGGPDQANQITSNVTAAVCLYNGSTSIDCDDAGWR
jgi:hypothetical protein